MFVLGYLYERAYAPLATVAFIILVMAADYLLSRWQWSRWLRLLAIIFGLALSVFAYSRSMPVLHDLKVFEDNIVRDINAAPRHAILHEYRFNGYSRFATPLNYVSATYFNRESTYCAYYKKDNVQFVDDTIYVRYHSGRLLDGARLMPLVSDRPEIADTVLSFPDQDYMIVVLNVDTLPPTPQISNYYLNQPDETLTEEDVAHIHEDYIVARRKWISEIRKDAEKEYTLGDVDKEVLDNFLMQLDKEMEFENENKFE
jgi:4-amino-4-deoxy-L-arabinose transferase-like glycosyltransferase